MFDADQAQPRHLEQRQEGDHDLPARLIVPEQLLEADVWALAEELRQVANLLGDRELLSVDRVDRPLCPIEHGLEGPQQLEHAELHERRGALHRRRINSSWKNVTPQQIAIAQIFSRGLVLLVLEQPADQLSARIFLLALLSVLVRLARVRRQEHPRLDVGERGGHHQVLGGHVDLQISHQPQVLGVLLGDERDGDVEDVELVLLHQVEQQIERPLKALDGHAIHRVIGLLLRARGCELRLSCALGLARRHVSLRDLRAGASDRSTWGRLVRRAALG